MKRHFRFGLLAVISLFANQNHALAAGNVASCDEASLRTALVGGGSVTFSASGTIALANTLVITNDTSIDAGGQAVTLSGNNAVRIFSVNPGVSLTLRNLALTDGLAQGTNGATGMVGGPGQGGAVYNNVGILLAADCMFFRNTALGGTGGSNATITLPTGVGGSGQGGGIYNFGGQIFLTNCTMAGNHANGGVGGATLPYTWPVGSLGQGGGICNFGGQIFLTNCKLISNGAKGGAADISYASSPGGGSAGGAIYSTNGLVKLVSCLVSTNTSISGRGHNIGGSAASGFASGGAIQIDGGNLTLLEDEFSANISQVEYGNLYLNLNPARGGAITMTSGSLAANQCFFGGNWVLGGRFFGSYLFGDPGGDAFGGSLCILGGTAGLTNSTLSSNYVGGGAAGYGDNLPGSGFGGAVYNAATMYLLNCTVAGNAARAGTNFWQGVRSAQQGGAYGGGLCNNGGTMTLDQVTLANNAAVPSGPIDPYRPIAPITLGGNLFGTNGSLSLRNSILANSLSGSNSFGALTDLGHNLSSDVSASFTRPGSLNSTDPKLGPLDNYGGPTPTMALLTGSPAIDTGDDSTFPPADQRGHARPYGSARDIGAFESSPPYVIRGAVAGATLNEEVGVVTATTNVTTFNRGNFSLEGLAAGAYSVVPTSSNFVFYPTNRLVSVGPDQLGVNFNAYHWNMLSLESATNGVLRLVFAGTNGQQYRMLASSNLANWFPVSTNTTGTSNLFEFIDSTVSSNRTRFYQTVSP